MLAGLSQALLRAIRTSCQIPANLGLRRRRHSSVWLLDCGQLGLDARSGVSYSAGGSQSGFAGTTWGRQRSHASTSLVTALHASSSGMRPFFALLNE